MFLSLASSLLNGVLSIIIKLVNVILYPLNLAISLLLPDLTLALAKVESFFDYLGDFVPLVMSYLGFDDTMLSLFGLMLTFLIVAPTIVFTIKLAIKWYNALKP